MRGADLLAATLAAAGVRRIFSLSGNQIMPVYDACIDAGIDILHTRHEAAAVFMADAWAQLTGEVGVALVTAAPGFGNALGALYSARASESPVLLLSGDAPVALDGRGAFQEMDQCAASAPWVKHAARPASADRMGEETARALRLAAAGRPGPVHLALPFDVLNAETGAPVPDRAACRPDRAAPAEEAVAALRVAMDGAARPVILAGPAMTATRAGDLPDRLAAALGAPVLPMESPRGLGDPALGDLKGVLGQADLILALGKRVDFTLGLGKAEAFAAGARWIVVDAETPALEMARANLGDRLDRALEADPHALAEALSRGSPAADRAGWRDEAARRTAARAPDPGDPDGRVTPAELTAAVQRAMAAHPGAVAVCDGGEFGQWAQAGLGPAARVINGPSGAIGGGICYAIAARAARPAAPVFALMGDGTVGFHLAEFETAARAGLPVVAVIGNDACWNAEHQIQLRDYGPDRLIACELSGARYDAAVAALGGHGEYVTEAADLDAALARAVASGKPACVNVRIAGLPAPSGAGH